MTDKELVERFFKEGYEYRNFAFILDCVAADYLDHSPAGARSNQDAVNILTAVAGFFGEMQVEMLDIFAENGMVATRVAYTALHTGEFQGIPATGKRITFEALENFRVAEGKIVESWGYWPDDAIRRMLEG